VSESDPSPKISAVKEILTENLVLQNRLWLSRFSEDEGIRTLATQVWELRGQDLSLDYGNLLLPLMSFTSTSCLSDGTEVSQSSLSLSLSLSIYLFRLYIKIKLI
jgi:hypothetical protein